MGSSLSYLWTNFFTSERKIETNNKAQIPGGVYYIVLRTGMSHPRIFEIPVFTGKFLLKTRSYRPRFGYFVENWSKIVMISHDKHKNSNYGSIFPEGTNKCSSNYRKLELKGFELRGSVY